MKKPTDSKTHFAIPLAQAIQAWLPNAPGKDFILRVLCRVGLPQQGLYLTRIGKLWTELDYSDRMDRRSALGLLGRDIAEGSIAHLDPGDCFCDCGAHIGIVSLWVASYLGEGGLVYAFEPSPPTFQRLQRNFALSQGSPCKLEAYPYALGEQSGTAEMCVSSQHGWSTLSRSALTASQTLGAKLTQVASVPVCTLDDFFLGTPGRRLPQAIKIDVEGWEENVLRGATRLLAQAPPRIILIEKNDDILQAMGCRFDPIDRILRNAGYRLAQELTNLDLLYQHD